MVDIESIRLELRAPVKTFRIFALEKILKSGRSAELLAELEQCQLTEEDSECLMLIEHAKATIKERLKTRGSSARQDHTGDFAALHPSKQLAYARDLKIAGWKETDERIDDLVEKSAHPVVTAALIKKFQHIWPPRLLAFCEKNLFNKSSALQLACLELLVAKDPARLQKSFEKLVLAHDPLLRAMAIRGLARRFPEAAAGFLADALRKGDYYTRLAALRVISVMPFDQLRQPMLEKLGNETDKSLLKIISAILLANPDREVPFRICDLIEHAPPERQKMLNGLLKKYIDIMRSSGICEDFEAFFEQLQGYHRRLKARLFVFNCLDAYEEADKKVRNEIARQLSEKKSDPAVMEALNTEEAMAKAADLVKLILSGKSVDEAAKADEAEAKLIKTLIRMRNSGKKPEEDVVAQVLNAKYSAAIVSSALKAAAACNDLRWADNAEALLFHDNENLVAAALEYLAVADTDSFAVEMRSHISSPSILVRTAILRSLSRIFPDDARNLLRTMLFDSSVNMRSKALGAVIHFDFSFIRELLLEFLAREKDTSLLKTCLYFFVANPMLENLYELDCLAEKRKMHAELFESSREQLAANLVAMNIANEHEIKELVEEKERRALAKTIEHNKQLEEMERLKKQVNWKNLTNSIQSIENKGSKAVKFVVGFIAFTGLMYFLATFGGGDEPDRPRETQAMRPVASEVQDYLVTVENPSLSDGSVLGYTEDKTWIVALPRPGKSFVLRQGEKVRIRAMPFRKSAQGTLIVKTLQISREN